MRKAVLLNDLVTSDITYGCLYEEYKRLLDDELGAFPADSLADIACPGCGKRDNKDIYRKMRMNFKRCAGCGSDYVSPRPAALELERFYAESKAMRFWREQSLNLPEEKLANLHGPRVNWILDLADEFPQGDGLLADFETKYPFFIKRMREQGIFSTIAVINQRLYERSCLLPEGVMEANDIEGIRGRVSVMTSFEGIERMFNPRDFFSIAGRCCKPGGLLLITTNTSSGFEFQVLGGDAPNINPINRMNLLSLEALKSLVEEAGFEIIELSTPGRLDVELVRRVVNEGGGLEIHPFWRYIFKSRTAETWGSLQNFLQLNRLSSHVRIAARKKAGADR